MIHADGVFFDLLAYIETHLDDALSLEALSGRMGMSPTSFHKAFRAQFGMTPRAHVEKTRLDRAALRLLIHDETVLQVALDHGFTSHETFTRAFGRRFGVSPQSFRLAQQTASRQRLRRAREGVGAYELSSTQVRRLAPSYLATLRHVGPYEDVPEALFAALEAWANALGLGGTRVWMGIGHDAPGVTPAHALRFDAAIAVPEPFVTDGNIVCQRFDGGAFAVTTHAGPFSTLSAAYGELVPRVLALRSHTYSGGPVVEIYKASEVLITRAINVTDICLPLTSRDDWDLARVS